MKQIVVLSGARGAGRTTLVAALAHVAAEQSTLVLADANVETPNLGLLLGAETRDEQTIFDGQEALIAATSCTACARCAEVCRFDAIYLDGETYRVDTLRCVGCALCADRCSEAAITLQPREAGRWRRAETRLGPLFHARLRAGLENTGRLITEVKEQAARWAAQQRAGYLLIDGPAGVGLSALAASVGAQRALIVADPTATCRQDLERLLTFVESLAIPPAVLINREDVNPARVDELNEICAGRGCPVVGRIPLDPAITQAMRQDQTVTALGPGPAANALRETWGAIETLR